MVRTTKPAARRREEILDAALRLFTTKGFQATTIDDILSAVGIAKGTLYYHFPGKEQILRALVLRTVTQVAERARAIADSAEPPLSKLLAILATANVEGTAAELVEQFHAPGNAEFHLMSIVELVRHLSPIVAEVIAEGTDAGVFTTDHPLEVTEILLTTSGVLLDAGIFIGEESELERRAVGVVHAAETLLGCPRGTLAPVLARFPRTE